MRVSDIDIQFLKLLSDMYFGAQATFGIDPIAATIRQQKKIHRWITKHYAEELAEFPKKILAHFSPEKTDAEVLSFLKECHEQIQLHGTWKKQLFDKFSVGLADVAKSALWDLLQTDIYVGAVTYRDNELEIILDDTSAFCHTIVLEQAWGVPDETDCVLSFSGGGLTKKGDEYCLYGGVECEEESKPFAIRFADARVEVTVFNATANGFGDTPWEHLQSIAYDVCQKASLLSGDVNESEQKLLPLLTEINRLGWWEGSLVANNTDFPLLKGLFGQYGLDRLAILLERIEQEDEGKKRSWLIQRLNDRLNDRQCEPLWRAVFETIKASQTTYPSKAQVCCPSDLLAETKSTIQGVIEQHGFSGSYPNFVKEGTLRGVRLAESYGMSYFVGAEKHVVYHIHCAEEWNGGALSVQFLCGTAFLKDGEKADDIYACIFNSKGRRVFQSVWFESGEMVEKSAEIAVKKVELSRLTKEERKWYYGEDWPVFGIFWSVFLIMGGLFGVLMTLGMMLIAVLMTIIFGQVHAIPAMFVEIPWWLLFLIAWVGFGGAMGIVTVWSKRK